MARVLAWKLPGYIGQAPNDPYLRRDAFEVLYPVEITFGILGACLPMLRPIVHRKEYASRATGESYAMERGQNSGSQTALTHDGSHSLLYSMHNRSLRQNSGEMDGVLYAAGHVESHDQPALSTMSRRGGEDL